MSHLIDKLVGYLHHPIMEIYDSASQLQRPEDQRIVFMRNWARDKLKEAVVFEISGELCNHLMLLPDVTQPTLDAYRKGTTSIPFKTCAVIVRGIYGKRHENVTESIVIETKRSPDDLTDMVTIFSECEDGAVDVGYFAPETDGSFGTPRTIVRIYRGNNKIAHYPPEEWYVPEERIKQRYYYNALNLSLFLTALDLTNAHLQTKIPAGWRQRERKRKGEHPLMPYHVLTLRPHKETENAGTTQTERESPRAHLRRGHTRRLPKQDKQVWVKPCVIGDLSDIVSDKRYRIEV